ncbi:50S ribosomal protein L32 [uncultured Clostridium sp.]|uniref:50S ribosomal protein L32 n=1 Tax=uncultured Clostridium sp. TaxID=59620 RepID=UPI00262A830C|nr:50S ribosomal protein L32 [uncultured Clostridium sp.]
MGNPTRKMSKSKRDSRRAQTYKLSAPTIVACPNCGEMKVPHRVCKSCGNYNGKEIIAVTAE